MTISYVLKMKGGDEYVNKWLSTTMKKNIHAALAKKMEKESLYVPMHKNKNSS